LKRKQIYTRIKALFGVREGRQPEPPRKEQAATRPKTGVRPKSQAKSPRSGHGDGDPLRSRLQRALDKGVALEQRVAHPLGFAGASVLTGPSTRQEDVDAWEARVESLLHDRPRDLSLFRYNEPTTGFERLTINPLANPLRDRLRRRNIQLEKIIRDL
jgi:hypothetical protein